MKVRCVLLGARFGALRYVEALVEVLQSLGTRYPDILPVLLFGGANRGRIGWDSAARKRTWLLQVPYTDM